MSVAAQTLSPPSRTLMFLEGGRAISELGAFLGALPLLSLAPRGDGHLVGQSSADRARQVDCGARTRRPTK